MSPYVPTALIRAQSDERLARLAALGSERAFESIVERYRQPLLMYARRLVGESRAEDVVQASFVAAWTDLRRGSEIREVKAWLYRVVHNRSLNVLKRSDNSDVPLIDAVRASGPGVAAEVEDRDAIRATLREIAELPERQRVALLAVAVDGRRHRDVGIELGLSEGAVKMLVSRARGTLRAAAGAFVPWPILLRVAGLGGGAGSATGAGGLGMLGASALKAGAVLATAGAIATAGPPALHAIQASPAPSAAPAGQVASATPGTAFAGAPAGPALPVPAGGGTVTGAPQATAPGGATPTPPGASGGPGAPATPAGTPAVTPSTAAPAVQHTDTVSSVPSADFLTQAGLDPVDDDLIVVVEDPPDLAHGEQAIGPDGVPDAIANSITDEAPDPGDDPPEPDTAAGDPATDGSAAAPAAPAADPAAASPATPDPAAPATARDLSAGQLSQ